MLRRWGRKNAVKSKLGISQAFGFVSIISIILLHFSPTKTIDNFLLVEFYVLLLFISFFTSTVISVHLTIVRWKKSSYVQKIIGILGLAIWLIELSGLQIYYGLTPNVVLQIEYTGNQDKIYLDIIHPYGAMGTTLEKGKSLTENYEGPVTRLILKWGKTFEERRDSMNVVNFEQDIPEIGDDILIEVMIGETLTYTISPKPPTRAYTESLTARRVWKQNYDFNHSLTNDAHLRQ